MTKTETITLFELIVNDITELSTSEEQALYDRVYNRICLDRPWEFLKKTGSGTILSDADGYYITAPSDFAFFVPSTQYTNNSISNDNDAAPNAVFVGSNNAPYQVINWSDRRQYTDQTRFVYYQPSDDTIRFNGNPSSDGTTYSFDYMSVPTSTAAGSSPALPTRFHEMIAYGMATENDVLQLSDKARSYKNENQRIFDDYMEKLAYWNANLIQN